MSLKIYIYSKKKIRHICLIQKRFRLRHHSPFLCCCAKEVPTIRRRSSQLFLPSDLNALVNTCSDIPITDMTNPALFMALIASPFTWTAKYNVKTSFKIPEIERVKLEVDTSKKYSLSSIKKGQDRTRKYLANSLQKSGDIVISED